MVFHPGRFFCENTLESARRSTRAFLRGVFLLPEFVEDLLDVRIGEAVLRIEFAQLVQHGLAPLSAIGEHAVLQEVVAEVQRRLDDLPVDRCLLVRQRLEVDVLVRSGDCPRFQWLACQ
ncbi:MAG: hypothetical protein J6Y80_02535 [Victivallales bacterium]|nr:hypothetical protein [Victivallales bacterium]